MTHNKLNILIYHRVLDVNDKFNSGDVTVEQFDHQLLWIKRFYNIMDLGLAVDLLKSNRLPKRALSITFDDGYRDNYTNALPILKKFELTATFFIAAGFLNGGIMWNDVVIESVRKTRYSKLDLSTFELGTYNFSGSIVNEVSRLINDLKYLSFSRRNDIVKKLPELLGVAVPDDLMMTDSDVQMLSKEGMGIGGHTMGHPILSRISADKARAEIEQGKSYLENLINKDIDLFAYPNGKPNIDYTKEHPEILKHLGFKAAVSTAHGVATEKSDIYQLPRFTPWDRTIPRFLLRLEKVRWSQNVEHV